MAMPDMQDRPTMIPPKPRTRWLLTGSLILNVLFLGMAGGAIIGHWRDGRNEGRDIAFGPFTEALSTGDRAALRAKLAERMPNLRNMREQMRQDFADVISAIRQTPFDETALRAAFAALGQRMSERLSIGQDLLIGHIAEMSPDARQALADRLQDRLDHPVRSRMHDQ